MLLNFQKSEIKNPDHALLLALVEGEYLNECQMLEMASPIGIAEEIYRSHRQAQRRLDQTFVVAQFIHFLYQCALAASRNGFEPAPRWLEDWLQNPFAVVEAKEPDPTTIGAYIKLLIEGKENAENSRALSHVVRKYHDALGRREFKRIFRECFTESMNTYTATFKQALETQTFSTYLMLAAAK